MSGCQAAALSWQRRAGAGPRPMRVGLTGSGSYRAEASPQPRRGGAAGPLPAGAPGSIGLRAGLMGCRSCRAAASSRPRRAGAGMRAMRASSGFCPAVASPRSRRSGIVGLLPAGAPDNIGRWPMRAAACLLRPTVEGR